MANPDHIAILEKGIDAWNSWRSEHPKIQPDLSDSWIPSVMDNRIVRKLQEVLDDPSVKPPSIAFIQVPGIADPPVINFTNVNFRKARMKYAVFPYADCTGADFREADLSRAMLCYARLSNCNLRKAYFAYSDLRYAQLTDSNLNRASFVQADIRGTLIENCIVYGTSVWGLITDENTRQRNLVIEDTNGRWMEHLSMPLMVDDIEVAQFIHLITENNSLGKGLKAVLEKGVLLLGKFKDGGRKLLDDVATEIRKQQLIPIIFDFDNPRGATLLDTVTVLAGISKFVIAHLDGPSVAAELTKISSTFTRPIITYAPASEENNLVSILPSIIAENNVSYFKYSTRDEMMTKLLENLVQAEHYYQQNNLTNVEKAKQKIRNG